MGSAPSKQVPSGTVDASPNRSNTKNSAKGKSKMKYDLYALLKRSRSLSSLNTWKDLFLIQPPDTFLIEDAKKGPILLYIQAIGMHSSFPILLHQSGLCSINNIPIADMIHFQYWDLCLKRDSFICCINDGLQWVSTDDYRHAGHILLKKKGPTRLLGLLIKEGLSLNQIDGKNKETILHVAVEQNNLSVVKILLSYISQVRNPQKKDQYSFLGKPILDQLDIHLLDRSSKTPFILACEKDYIEIVKEFLCQVPLKKDLIHGVNVASTSVSPIEVAVRKAHFEILKEFIQNEMDIEYLCNGNTETIGKIEYAKESGFILIKPDESTSGIHGTPIFILIHNLFHAPRTGEEGKNDLLEIKILKMIDLLLQEKADLNRKHIIIEYTKKKPTGEGEGEETLIEIPPSNETILTPMELLTQNLNANSSIAIHLLNLSISQQLPYASILLYAQGPRNIVSEHGSTLLHTAIKVNSPLISKILADTPSITYELFEFAIERSASESICLKLYEILREDPKMNAEFDYPELLKLVCENDLPEFLEVVLDSYAFEKKEVVEAATTALCNGYINTVNVFEAREILRLSDLLQYRDFNGNTPLHLSVNNPKLKPPQLSMYLKQVTREMQAGRFSFEERNNDGLTVADVCAAHARRFDLLIQLAKAKIEIGNSYYPPFNDNIAISAASSTCTPSEFKKLIKLSGGAKEASYKNKRGSTPLHIATINNNIQLMKILLVDYRVDVHSLDDAMNTPLHFATSEAAVQLLLENGASPNRLNASKETKLLKISQGMRAPAKATSKIKDYKIARLLLEYGADPNIPDIKGNTPMHYASLGAQARSKYEFENHLLKLLLDYGADPSLQNNSGDTPMHLLFHRKLSLSYKRYILQQFIQRGASVNSVNKDRMKPIHLLEGRINMKTQSLVQMLVKEGCEYECTNCYNHMKDPSKFLNDIESVLE